MATCQEIVTDAFLEAGVNLQAGQTPNTERLEWGRRRLNRILEGLGLSDFTIYTELLSTYTPPINVLSFTLGPTGTVVGPRPIRIDRANIILAGANQQRIHLYVMSKQEYAEESQKVIRTTLPWAIYSDGAVPNTNVYMVGQPTTTYTLEIFQTFELPQFASLADQFTAPPGYKDMLLLELAVATSQTFTKAVAPALMQMAIQAKHRVIRSNVRTTPLISDAPGCGGRGTNTIWETGIR